MAFSAVLNFVFAGPKQGMSGFTFVRGLCLLTKALRVLKFLRSFAHLRVMMDANTASLALLFWMLMILISIFYTFALTSMHGDIAALEHSDLDQMLELRACVLHAIAKGVPSVVEVAALGPPPVARCWQA